MSDDPRRSSLLCSVGPLADLDGGDEQMKLVNKDAGMTIGIMYVRSSDAIERGYWLYSQVGRERILHARMNNNSTARRLLQTLIDWDAAGGNDGGVEE